MAINSITHDEIRSQGSIDVFGIYGKYNQINEVPERAIFHNSASALKYWVQGQLQIYHWYDDIERATKSRSRLHDGLEKAKMAKIKAMRVSDEVPRAVSGVTPMAADKCAPIQSGRVETYQGEDYTWRSLTTSASNADQRHRSYRRRNRIIWPKGVPVTYELDVIGGEPSRGGMLVPTNLERAACGFPPPGPRNTRATALSQQSSINLLLALIQGSRSRCKYSFYASCG